MRDVEGLTESIRRRRCQVADDFLVAHLGKRPLVMAAISANSARCFILDPLGWNPPSVAAIGELIGCYLRFRNMSGGDLKV